MTAIARSASDLAHRPAPRPLAPAPASDRIRVLVVDGDPIARSAAADLLRASGRCVVVATAGDGRDGAELALHYRPDVLITAAELPGLDGVSLVRRLAAEAPEVRAVVFAVERDEAGALDALLAGAAGIVAKEAAGDGALVDTVAAVHGGDVSVPPRVARHLVERLRRVPEPGRGVRPIRSDLTSREWEVLDLLAAGLTTREIAERLVLTEDTVYTHVKNLFRKLGVHSREQAVRAARDLVAGAVA